MINNSNPGLTFEPWKGKNYENSGFGKILLLGESHYEKGIENPLFTKEIIEEFLSGEQGKGYTIYANIGYLFSDDCRSIWNEIAFSNLIQNYVPDAQADPQKEDFNKISSIFWLLLESLLPDKVIVCSKGIWNDWVPSNSDDSNKKCIIKGEISENNMRSNLWQYDYTNGSCLAIGITHPSWMFGRNGTPQEWRPLIESFLSLKL